MKLKDVRNQRRVFLSIKTKNPSMINVDKISSIEHKDDKTTIYYNLGYVQVDDTNYDLYNQLGCLFVNDYEKIEVKTEKEQG